jgi:C1A family cysteine protease
MPRTTKKYGWVPDLPDARDHLYAAPRPFMLNLPARVDLRPQCPPVYNQGELGSCTGNAIGAAIQFDRMKQNLAQGERVPSRLFIYYNERVIEGTVDSDSGAQIRDGIKCAASTGACFEGTGTADWPYDINQFTQKPRPACYDEALKIKAASYSRLTRNLNQMKGCLASGYPFVFGFTVYDSFEGQQVAATGEAPMPAPGEQMVGGHAVMAVGYDDAGQRFVVRNSWGSGWGQAGYFTLPYAYLTDGNLSDDFWTIRLLTSGA